MNWSAKYNEMEILLRVRNNANYPVKLMIENIFKDKTGSYIGKYSLSGYESEKDLLRQEQNLEEMYGLDMKNVLLQHERKSFETLEDNVLAEELIPKNGEVILTPFELTVLKFRME